MSYNLQRLLIFPRGTLLSFCCLLYLLASHSTPNAIMGGPINQTSWLERPQLDREEAEEPLIFVLTSDSAIAGTPTIISREGLPGGEREPIYLHTCYFIALLLSFLVASQSMVVGFPQARIENISCLEANKKDCKGE